MVTKQIGDSVTYVDPVSKERAAIVTNVFGGNPDIPPSINVAFVSDDESRGDNYGRQLERQTSVPHQTQQQAHGNYWK